MSYALPMDLDDVSRRLLAARRVAGSVPDKEVRQGADREVGQFAGDGARGDGFADQSPKVKAAAELSGIADLHGQAKSGPAASGVCGDRFVPQGLKVEASSKSSQVGDLEQPESESLESEAESRPAETTKASEGHGAPRSVGHANGNRGVARHSPRRFGAAVARRAEAGRSTAAEAAAEARFIVRLVNLGQITHERARALIVVPEGTEAELRAFAAENPMDASLILNALKFRRRVLAEFERLCASAACSTSSAADRVPEGALCAAVGLSAEELGLDESPSEERIVQTSADAGVA